MQLYSLFVKRAGDWRRFTSSALPLIEARMLWEPSIRHHRAGQELSIRPVEDSQRSSFRVTSPQHAGGPHHER